MYFKSVYICSTEYVFQLIENYYQIDFAMINFATIDVT